MICSGSHAVSGIRPGASVINTLVSIDACRYSQGDEVESVNGQFAVPAGGQVVVPTPPL